MRIFWFILFSIIIIIPLKAEVGVSAGVRAGFNISSLRKFSPPEFYKKRIVLGSNIAAILRIDFNKYIGLQTEVEFSQKGQSWKRSIDSAKYQSKFVLNYVQFPILAVARFGSEKYKAAIYLGPYFSYWIGGYTQNSVSVDKQSRNSNSDKYLYTKNDNRFDVGLVAGVGGDFKVGKGWIQTVARYNVGFLPINKNSVSSSKLYNNNFNFSIGYLYTIK